MTSKITSLMLGIGLLATSASLAAAADWNNGAGSIKDYRGSTAVPVPAPAPIPVSPAQWYLRGDIGFAASSSGSATSTGPYVDITSTGDLPRYFGATFGIGRYITPSIRADFTIDYRSRQRMMSNVTTNQRDVTQVSTVNVVGGAGAGTSTRTDVSHWSDSYHNEANIGHYAAMINAYYDIRTGSRFTPYVGAGVGVAMHELTRTADDTHVCNGTDTTIDAVAGIGYAGYTGSTSGCTTATASYSNAKETTTAYGFAGALMAGVSFEVSPGILWDSGYRLMYLNGNVAQSSPTGLGASLVKVGDRTDHEFRTGFRWNID